MFRSPSALIAFDLGERLLAGPLGTVLTAVVQVFLIAALSIASLAIAKRFVFGVLRIRQAPSRLSEAALSLAGFGVSAKLADAIEAQAEAGEQQVAITRDVADRLVALEDSVESLGKQNRKLFALSHSAERVAQDLPDEPVLPVVRGFQWRDELERKLAERAAVVASTPLLRGRVRGRVR